MTYSRGTSLFAVHDVNGGRLHCDAFTGFRAGDRACRTCSRGNRLRVSAPGARRLRSERRTHRRRARSYVVVRGTTLRSAAHEAVSTASTQAALCHRLGAARSRHCLRRCLDLHLLRVMQKLFLTFPILAS